MVNRTKTQTHGNWSSDIISRVAHLARAAECLAEVLSTIDPAGFKKFNSAFLQSQVIWDFCMDKDPNDAYQNDSKSKKTNLEAVSDSVLELEKNIENYYNNAKKHLTNLVEQNKQMLKWLADDPPKKTALQKQEEAPIDFNPKQE